MDVAPREQVEIHPAPAAARAWALCAILRTVRGDAAPLAARVHANTFACLNVVARGAVRCEEVPQPQRFLVGPLSRPLATSTEGELRSASLVLQPWVLEPWFGLRPDALADALVPVPAAPGAPADALCAALRAACDHACAMDAVWTALLHLAATAPPDLPALALDVLRADGVAAAARSIGVSERQYRRRFRRAQGLAPAGWLRVRRWEATVQGLLAPGSALPLAALAADHGYADQAHLARETQSFVRTSPTRLRGAADWSLAPARVRILQDGEPGAA